MVNLWNREEANPSQNDDRQGIEPTSNVSQEPKWKTKLNRVQYIFDLNIESAVIWHIETPFHIYQK